MGFQYRRSTGSDNTTGLLMLDIDPTYAATAKKGDLVKYNASNKVVAAAAGDAEILGVLENVELRTPVETDRKGHVRTDASALYEAPFTGGTPTAGTAYGITSDNKVDVANTTNTPVTVVELRGNNVLVQITGRQLA